MTDRCRALLPLLALLLGLLDITGVLGRQSLHAQESYFLNGSAQAVGEICYQITAAVNTQNGTVWYANPIDLTEPFDLQFTMNFGTNDSNGADGMVFVLQTAGTDAIGESGGGMGFNGFDPSFGVEFDTWQNSDYNDPFGDHIAFVSNGSVSHTAPSALGGPVNALANGGNIEDGQDHVVRIAWDPVSQTVTASFDCEERLSAEIDLIGDVFNGSSLVTFGFSGSTGGANNNQTVCLQDNIITTGPNAFVCPGESVMLSAVGLPESTFSWTPAQGLDDPNSATPICTPEETTTYVVSYESFCDGLVSDSVLVTVEPIEVDVTPDGPFVLTCATDEVDFAAVSNFSAGVNYLWTTTDGNLSATAGPFATADAPGTYQVVATATNGGCAAEAFVEVVEDLSVVTFDITTDVPQLTCTDTVVNVSASLDGPATINWAGTAEFALMDDFNIEVYAPGTITIETEHPTTGCTWVTEVDISQDITAPVVDAGQADSLTCLSPTSVVEGILVSPAAYTAIMNWVANDEEGGIINPLDPFAPVIGAAGTYALSVTFLENGCESSDTLVVASAVPPPVDISSVTLPNVITPNNDNKNDGLALFLADEPSRNLMELIDSYQLRVFNRWGDLVYQNTGLPIRWKGNASDGDLLNAGTYYVIVDYKITCGGVQEGGLHGDVKILTGTP